MRYCLKSAFLHRRICDILSVIADGAAVRVDNAKDQVEQRGFAAAGRTEDGDNFTVLNTQRNIFQHLCAVECFANMLLT